MSKKSTQESSQAVVLTEEQKSELVSAETEQISSLMDLFEHFEVKPAHELRSLTSEYLEMKENSEYNFAFVGMGTFTTSEGEVRECAELVSKEGKKYINGGAVLVSACKRIQKVPALVRIVTKGKKNSSSGSGKYLDMDILTI